MSKPRASAGHLRNGRESSPRADEYHTGYSDFNTRNLLHSTEQDLQFTDREQYATRFADDQEYENDDNGSASMSIEYGRGLKRSAVELDDISSNVAFPIGDNSEYEITKTPPIGGMTQARQVSLRKANEGAKRTTSQTAKASATLSDAIRANKFEEHTTESVEIVLQTKNTRFTHKKLVPVTAPSGQHTTPAQASRFTSQPTADTGDWALPDLSNIGDLIDPAQKDGTARILPGKKASRFTPSATHRMPVRFEGTDRLPVRSVPIPEDEKKIYAALQTLQEKFNQLELDNAEAGKQLDNYERENIELRNALAREEQLRRPDSALGSEDETAKEKWRLDRTKLQSSLRSLQQRFDKVEHKLKVRESDLRACTSERDDLITQLGVECYRLQEVEAENAQLRQDHELLRIEVNDLKQELVNQRTGASRLVAKDITGTFGHRDNTRRSSRFTSVPKAVPAEDVSTKGNCINFDRLDTEARQHIANVVKQQWQHQQDRSATASRQHGRGLQSTMFDIDNRPAKAQKAFVPPVSRAYKATVETQDDEDAYTEFEHTTTKNLTGKDHAQDINDDDVTELSANDPSRVREIIKLIEDQRRALQLKHRSSAPIATQPAPVPQNRRSSFRDLTGTIASDNKRTVRVQSPELEDQRERDEDTRASLPSNLTRRRYNATQDDGETSGFIIPDITLHRRASMHSHDVQDAKHDKRSCSVCSKSAITDMTTPAVVPVSTRDDLPEDATVRPSQPSRSALARVLKQLSDELAHLKLVLASYQKQHSANNPAIGARARKQLYDKISELMAECKRKEDQIYALYDAVEGQAGAQDEEPKSVKQRVATPAKKKTADAAVPAFGLDGAYDAPSDGESVGLPVWEGLSEDED